MTNTLANEKARVLIVDDSRVIRKAIKKILKDDAEIIEADQGEAGWNALLAKDDTQVLITDVEMPILDGYQLICRIRASDNEQIKNIPIITITGSEDDETKERAFACGATDFITKPLDKVQLKARVRAHAKLDETTKQLQETTATLEEEATTDPLTGVHSRRYFNKRGEQDMAHTKRHNSVMALLRIDIDDFKKLYQKLGDETADELLIWTARKITETARTEDTVARIGGSQFAVLAPATGMTEAAVLGERLRTAINEKAFVSAKTGADVTVSIGIVTYAQDNDDTLNSLIAHANERLRNARAGGGNSVSTTTRSEEATAEEVTLETDAAALVFNETATEPGAQTVADDTGSELSVEELEKRITLEAEEDLVATSIATNARTIPSANDSVPADLIDINQALAMLGNGQAEIVKPFLLDLAVRILPILEASENAHRLGLTKEIDSIKERIFSAK